MGKISEFCNALTSLGDGRYHYYRDSDGTGIGCSDYVRMALGLAGVITTAEAENSTSLWAAQRYRVVLRDTARFKELPASTTPQKGDIMWYHGHHVSVCAGGSDVWEAAPESTHGICSNGKTGVGLWKNHNYNCSGGTLTCIYRIIEDSNTTLNYKVGDKVTISGIYTSSNSSTKLNPAITKGIVKQIVDGSSNPYLIYSEDGKTGIGWTNEKYMTATDTTSDTTTTTLSASERLKIAKAIVDGTDGWSGVNGTARKTKLNSLYGEADATIIQELINEAFE